MIKMAKTYSLEAAKRYWPKLSKDQQNVFISITGSNEVVFFDDININRISYHCFDDIWPTLLINENINGLEGLISMSPEDAKIIVRFLKHWNKEEQDIFVHIHCAAGVSRSGAIAEFCKRVFEIDEKEFDKENSIYPNIWCMSLLSYFWYTANQSYEAYE